MHSKRKSPCNKDWYVEEPMNKMNPLDFEIERISCTVHLKYKVEVLKRKSREYLREKKY